MRPKKPVLTDQELEIMKLVWARGEATVRDIYEALLAERKVAYTTVMTMMGILEEKGHLKRRQADRAYVYRPAQPRERVLGSMVRHFVDRVLDGSAKPLLQHLLENKKLSREELQELADLLAKQEKS